MAQSLTDKRRNIASRAVEAATKLVDAIFDLNQLRDERAVAGNFEDADFGPNVDLIDATRNSVNTVYAQIAPANARCCVPAPLKTRCIWSGSTPSSTTPDCITNKRGISSSCTA